MAEMSLAALVERGLARRVIGDGAVLVRGIRHDSRKVEPGDLFVAIAGERRHGSEFAAQAIALGAAAVLAQEPLALPVPVLVADDALVALAAIARALYDDPGAQLAIAGVTGTNGKTTTAYMVEAMLIAAERAPAVLGTINFRGPGGVREATHTTPMADDLMRLTRWAVETSATHLVLEVSSHGLAMHRVDGLHFDVAAFTNITHDHLDYHGDFESYGRAKRRLFEDLDPAVSVINVDDPFGAELAGTAHGRVLRCSRHVSAQADVRALSWSTDAHGLRARIATPLGECELGSSLVGEHNLENSLVAIGCGVGLGLPLDAIAAGLGQSRGAPGRLERVDHPQIGVFVDYAHTPDALERVLRALRAISPRRLLVVFGCGGDRDRQKRSVMGAIAGELADVVIATSDNPRSEPPEQILSEIEHGLVSAGVRALATGEVAAAERGYMAITDRRQAIRLAAAAAQAGDTLLIAGKGHEPVQIIGARREPFDDREEARAALAARPGGA
jgi:UDP-N-acetylmuramoyl-L-alanyl-D-glutamate--2,6-diaminopimelate ligase